MLAFSWEDAINTVLARSRRPREPGRGGEPAGDDDGEDQGGGQLPSGRSPAVHRLEVYSPGKHANEYRK